MCFDGVRPSKINYFIIEVHNPYREELIELNPGLSFFLKLKVVLLTVFLIKMSRFCLKKPLRSDGYDEILVDKDRQLNIV